MRRFHTGHRPGLRSLSIALLLGCALVACKDGDRSEVLVVGTLQQEDCAIGDILWQPGFATFHPGGDSSSGVIRIQTRTSRVEIQDHFALLVRDMDYVRDRLGEALPFDSRGQDALLSATLNFHERCPETRPHSTAAIGEVRFDEFSGERGSYVRFEASFDLVDSRHPDRVVGEGFEVEASFRIRSFPPYQPFNAAF